MRKLILFLLLIIPCISGCGAFSSWTSLLFGSDDAVPNPDEYRVGEHRWSGDTIIFAVYKKNEPKANLEDRKIEVQCRSCNLENGPKVTLLGRSNEARMYVPEARELIGVRVHVHGSGIDTTFIQKQRAPEDAQKYFALSRHLVGRIMTTQLALLYRDTTQDSVLTSALLGDELNIYGERSAFYIAHHPSFADPVYLLKSDAVRLY